MASWAACAAGPGGRPVAGIEVLLRHGAERDALDDRGRTPLAWLAQAAKSVDEHAVRDALETGTTRRRVERVG